MLNGAKIILSGQDGMTNGHYNNIFQQHTMTVLNIRQLWRSILATHKHYFEVCNCFSGMSERLNMPYTNILNSRAKTDHCSEQ